MNSKVMELLKLRDYVVPSYLIKNYDKLGLSAEMTLLLIYIINLKEPIVCDYQKMAIDLNIDLKELMTRINELVEKKVIEIEIKKNSASKLEEYINLELFYNKIFLQLIDVEKEETHDNIYSIFEKEFGRGLSPIEYELINGWIECNYKEEIILAALREAVFNGVNNFRYIDRILFEWNKKGIDTLEKIEKNKINRAEKKQSNNNIEVPDYDWLNNSEQNF